MPKEYKFKPGDKVRIRGHIRGKSVPSMECKKHAGEVVTIKARSKITWAYYLEELPDLWMEGCFEEVRV